jgi:hypothetical protein
MGGSVSQIYPAVPGGVFVGRPFDGPVQLLVDAAEAGAGVLRVTEYGQLTIDLAQTLQN